MKLLNHIKYIDMSYLEEIIKKNDVIIVPGFIGESSEGKIISLGRNTSDLTAIIIAKWFNLNKVNIIKEVDGVYKKDPKKETSKIIEKVSYDEMLSLIEAGSNMFSKKTLKYAKDNEIIIEVKSLNKEKGTIISKEKSNENILFMNKEKDEIKVVFKDMKIFEEIFLSLIEKQVKLEDLIVTNNIIYLKGNNEQITRIIDKYL